MPGVVILTGSRDNLMARWLLRALGEAGRPPAALLIDSPDTPTRQVAPSAWSRYRRMFRRGLWHYAWCKFRLGLVRRLKLRPARRVPLLDELCSRFDVPLIPIDNINRPEGIARLSGLTPDVLVMIGCRILKPAVLQVPRLAFNFHTGILPDYRGSDCFYWALHNNEAEKIGYSIHEGVEALDGGEVFFEERVPPRPGEMFEELFDRCVLQSVPHWLRLLESVAGGGRPVGRRLDLSLGRVYRSVDWLSRAEVENAWIRGRIRGRQASGS